MEKDWLGLVMSALLEWYLSYILLFLGSPVAQW